MKIPSFPVDEVQQAAGLVGEDNSLLRIVQELRGLANDAKPLLSLFDKFKEGYTMGQEKGKSQAKPPQIGARAGEIERPGQATPPTAGLTPEEIQIIVRDNMRQIILFYIETGVKMGYGDKTIAEILPTINIKLNDIKAMLSG
jgi:hypothetical protein